MKVLFMHFLPIRSSIVSGEFVLFLLSDFGFYFLLIGSVVVHIVEAGGSSALMVPRSE